MSMDTERQDCISCGQSFQCGIGGSDPCWCSIEFPAAMPLPAVGSGCYCRKCLAALIAAAARLRENGAT